MSIPSLQQYCAGYRQEWGDVVQPYARSNVRKSESRYTFRQYFLAPETTGRGKGYSPGIQLIHGVDTDKRAVGQKYAPAIMQDSAYTAWRVAAWVGVAVALLGISVSISAPFIHSQVKLPLGAMIGGGVGASLVGGAPIAKFLHYSHAPLNLEVRQAYGNHIMANMDRLAEPPKAK